MSDYFENADGFERTCWIPREHGPDISLMIEIVTKLPKAPLFPPVSSAKKNSGNVQDSFSVAIDNANATSASKKLREPRDPEPKRLVTVKVDRLAYEHSVYDSQSGEDSDPHGLVSKF